MVVDVVIQMTMHDVVVVVAGGRHGEGTRVEGAEGWERGSGSAR